MPILVSVFDLPDDAATAIKKLRGRGFDELESYSPAPSEQIDEAMDERPSKVRVFTLIGMLVVGRLYPRRLDAAYSSRFSAEEFGVVVKVGERDVGEVDSLLRSLSAKEVSLLDE